jgi:Uma2 family endonuclease
MQTTAQKPITVRDFRELPEGPPYYQLIEGDLYMSPTPNLFHQRIVLNIVFMIRSYLEKHPIGELVVSPSDVELTEINAYVPDVYYVSNKRKHIFTKQGASGAPDLVVEVLSPSTARFDKGVKQQIYARTGVKEYWLVNPDAQDVSVFHLQESADQPVGVYGLRQKFTSPLLPKLTIRVARIFKQ